MLHTLLRAFITILGTMAIPGIVMLIQLMYEYISGTDYFGELPNWAPIVIYLVSGCISACVFFFLSNGIAATIEAGIAHLKRKLNDAPSISLLSGGIGLIIGLIVAALFSVVIGLIPLAWVSVPLTIIFYIIFGYLGATIGIERRQDVADYFSTFFARGTVERAGGSPMPKLLDASVIIDGRVFDIIRTGLLEGEIVIPDFVLGELQRVAAADDAMKRGLGRRGLDHLEQLQKEAQVPVSIQETTYPAEQDVDVRLVKLARDLNGEIVTTDYSLNKVASVQDIPVFNINDLANALKPILATGELIEVTIVKNGREPGQGVAYLPDGVMVVVDGAADLTGKTMSAIVTSTLQTSAGRLVFAKIED